MRVWWLETLPVRDFGSRGCSPAAAVPPRARVARPIWRNTCSGSVSKRPVRSRCFSRQGFAYSRKKTVSSILLETVMFHYRGATQIDCFSPLCSHTIICAGRITGPDPAGTYCWFGASLESPFLKCSHTAIPPPAALCNVRDSEYSSFSSVSLCFLYCTSLQSKSQSPV